MKFLCVECDAQMESVERSVPGDGTLSVTFHCPRCERRMAMLTNPMETQMVAGLCVQIGGRSAPEQPFETVRSRLATGGESALEDTASSPEGPRWSAAAETRLERVPGFVRGMVRRMYSEWARERGIGEITLEVMDTARAELGLEGT